MSQKGAYPAIKDSFKIVVMKERGMFDRKDCDPSVWCKCRNYSTMKAEKECLCCQEEEAVRDFNLQGIFVLSQANVLSELQKQSHGGVLYKMCS